MCRTRKIDALPLHYASINTGALLARETGRPRMDSRSLDGIRLTFWHTSLRPLNEESDLLIEHNSPPPSNSTQIRDGCSHDRMFSGR